MVGYKIAENYKSSIGWIENCNNFCILHLKGSAESLHCDQHYFIDSMYIRVCNKI